MTSALESLGPHLAAIAAADVRAPNQPVEIYLQETEDLIAHIQENAVGALLVDEGLEQTTLDRLPLALAAAREAQTAWTLTYEREKPQEQKASEKRGYALRALVAKKARFALRSNRAAQAVLSQILEGEGIADLVQDLDDLRMLLSHHSALIARNKNFDASAATTEMEALAVKIRKGLAGFRMSPEQAKAVDLRNRAWTNLDELVDDIREAGRAATEGKVARGFGSAYERHARAKRRRTVSNEEPQA